MAYNQHLCQGPKSFHDPKESPVPIRRSSPNSPSSLLRQPPVCFLWVFLFWVFPINGITQDVSFCVWLLALSVRGCDFKWEVKVKIGDVGKVTFEQKPEGGETGPCGSLGWRAPNWRRSLCRQPPRGGSGSRRLGLRPLQGLVCLVQSEWWEPRLERPSGSSLCNWEDAHPGQGRTTGTCPGRGTASADTTVLLGSKIWLWCGGWPVQHEACPQVAGSSRGQAAGSWTTHRGKGSGYAASGGFGKSRWERAKGEDSIPVAVGVPGVGPSLIQSMHRYNSLPPLSKFLNVAYQALHDLGTSHFSPAVSQYPSYPPINTKGFAGLQAIYLFTGTRFQICV